MLYKYNLCRMELFDRSNIQSVQTYHHPHHLHSHLHNTNPNKTIMTYSAPSTFNPHQHRKQHKYHRIWFKPPGLFQLQWNGPENLYQTQKHSRWIWHQLVCRTMHNAINFTSPHPKSFIRTPHPSPVTPRPIHSHILYKPNYICVTYVSYRYLILVTLICHEYKIETT